MDKTKRIAIYKDKKTGVLSGVRLDIMPYQKLEYDQARFRGLLKDNSVYSENETPERIEYYMYVKELYGFIS